MLEKLFKYLGKEPEKGVLAIFDHQDKLVEAIKKARGLNMSKMDAFTPFPIHEVIHALGLKRSLIPWATLVFGLSGASLLFLLQAWTSAVDWPINVGGKPFVSWPAFIPITFEGGILFGGVLTVITLFHLLKLPNQFRPAMDPRLTNDRFGLFIEEDDPYYNEEKLNEIFKQCGVEEVKKIDSPSDGWK